MSGTTDGTTDEALPTLEGRALCFGLALAAEEVLDPTHWELRPADARPHLFAALHAGLSADLAPGDVIVAEEVTGTESAARHAFAALAAAGIAAVVARRFAPAMVAAAHAAGIPPVVLDAPAFLRTGDRIRLDLDAAKIVNLSSGDRAAIRNASTSDERAALHATVARTSGR